MGFAMENGQYSTHSQLVRPPALSPGDRVAVLAPSGSVQPSRVAFSIELLQRMGFTPVVDESITDRRGYLAGISDIACGAAFTRAFADTSIRGVTCAKGGYGAMRILPHIDWSVIRANPKFFCGFSDITALHLAILKECGMVTFHGGGVPITANEVANVWNQQSMFAAMTGGQRGQTLLSPSMGPVVETVVGGVATGLLEGGNLTLLASLCGTRWQPQLRDKVLLLEDVSEAPYRIDRMLTQMHLCNVFDGVRGIVFGYSPTCEPEPVGDGFTLREVLVDRLACLGVPFIYGFPCGHAEYRATLPMGAMVTLDGGAGSLTIDT